MRVVVALGGNASLRRGQDLTDENQRENVAVGCDELRGSVVVDAQAQGCSA